MKTQNHNKREKPEVPPMDQSVNKRQKRKKSKSVKFQESILRQTDVFLSLAKQLISNTEAKSRNLVFSPLSIQIVLGLIAAGSNGPTKDQLLGFLKYKSIEGINSVISQLVNLLYTDGGPLGGPHLSFANGVWVDSSYNMKPAFKQIVDNVYKAVSDHVDFQTKAEEARQEVNKWAKEQTNGLIKEVLPSGSVNALTRLIFANALYFKGSWVEEFDKSETKRDKFFLLNGDSIKVPFVTRSDRQFIKEFDGFKVLKLPYKQGKDERKFSMYIYLPDEKKGLPSLLEKIWSESGFIEHHLPQESVEVGDFRIPKFKIDFGFEAPEVLKQLGLVLPFSPGGLTEMVQNCDDLYVTNIFHKSFIEVNEEGTEAAAATAGLLGVCCAKPLRRPEGVLDFVADHPFLFVIREDLTGVVFFIGQVINPDQTKNYV